jgi:hypothetical protein
VKEKPDGKVPLSCDKNIDKGTVERMVPSTYFKYILPVLGEFCEFFTSSCCYGRNIAQGMVEYGAFCIQQK